MRTKVFVSILVLFIGLLTAMTPLLAQEGKNEGESKPAGLFQRSDTLNVTMTAPWGDLQRKASYQGTYPGQINYTDELGNNTTLDMTAARRGITRQQVCKYPPVKLRFEKGAAKGTTFRGQKSLKVVTHCQKSSRYEQYYIMEMLIYRMYNLITEKSFRIRPLNVNYTDSESGKSDDDRFAFLIEDDSDVAKRNGVKKLKIPRVRTTQLDAQTASEFSLFQFMIGNTDWAALSGPDPKECCHNVKLIGPEPFQKDDIAYPVPYDFDSSGLVNTDYAAPAVGLPIRSVTQRLFRGYCRHNSTLNDARELFLEREDAIIAVLDEEPQLASKNRDKAEKYLKKFFEILRNDKDFNKKVIEKCRK